MFEVNWLACVLGLFIGTTLALTGAGGAVLTIPLLVLLFKLPIQQAAPIALLTVFIAASIGSVQGLLKGIVRYKAALLIAGIGSLLAPIGAYTIRYTSPQLLAILLACILMYIAIRSWFSVANHAEKIETPPCEVNPMTSKLFWTANCTQYLLGIGSLTGFLSGLLGVGGGFLIVPALKKVTNLDHASVIATTLAVTALVSVSAFFSQLQYTSIDWQIAIPLALSAATAILLTNQFSNKIPKQLSQKSFAALCLLAAISILWQ